MEQTEIFEVFFLGKDERGEIVKSVKILAKDSDEAMSLIREIQDSMEIYSALKIIK